jgi:hypothetical protein
MCIANDAFLHLFLLSLSPPPPPPRHHYYYMLGLGVIITHNTKFRTVQILSRLYPQKFTCIFSDSCKFSTDRPCSFQCLFFLCEVEKSLKVTAVSNGPLFFTFVVHKIRGIENSLWKILCKFQSIIKERTYISQIYSLYIYIYIALWAGNQNNIQESYFKWTMKCLIIVTKWYPYFLQIPYRLFFKKSKLTYRVSTKISWNHTILDTQLKGIAVNNVVVILPCLFIWFFIFE